MLAYDHYAWVEGGAENGLGKSGVARVYYRKAMALAKAAAADPENITASADYAMELLRSALLETPVSGLPESLEDSREAAGIFEALGTQYRNRNASAHECTGRRLVALGKGTEAIEEYRRALGLADACLLANPVDPIADQAGCDALRDLTRACVSTGDRGGALSRARELVRYAETIANHGFGQPFRESLIAQAWLELASTHRACGEWAPAQEAAQDALKQARPLLQGKPRGPDAVVVLQAGRVVAECEAELKEMVNTTGIEPATYRLRGRGRAGCRYCMGRICHSTFIVSGSLWAGNFGAISG